MGTATIKATIKEATTKTNEINFLLVAAPWTIALTLETMASIHRLLHVTKTRQQAAPRFQITNVLLGIAAAP